MKALFAVSCLLLVSTVSRAEPCLLKTPVPLPKNLPAAGVVFHHAVLDQAPRFPDQNIDKGGTAPLDLLVFPVALDTDRNTGYLAAAVLPQGDSGGNAIGAAQYYFGMDRDSFVGETKKSAAGETHGFVNHAGFNPIGGPEDPFYGCPYNGSGDAIYHTIVKTKDDMITSVQITFPVQLNWTNPRGEGLLGYTGEHQTVCVLSVDAPSEAKGRLISKGQSKVSRLIGKF